MTDVKVGNDKAKMKRWARALKAGIESIHKAQKDYAWEAKIYKIYGGEIGSYDEKAYKTFWALEADARTLEEILTLVIGK